MDFENVFVFVQKNVCTRLVHENWVNSWSCFVYVCYVYYVYHLYYVYDLCKQTYMGTQSLADLIFGLFVRLSYITKMQIVQIQLNGRAPFLLQSKVMMILIIMMMVMILLESLPDLIIIVISTAPICCSHSRPPSLRHLIARPQVIS